VQSTGESRGKGKVLCVSQKVGTIGKRLRGDKGGKRRRNDLLSLKEGGSSNGGGKRKKEMRGRQGQDNRPKLGGKTHRGAFLDSRKISAKRRIRQVGKTQ